MASERGEPDSNRVKELFADACDLPVADRERFLEAHCGGDADLRSQIQELLDAYDLAEAFMDVDRTVGPLVSAGIGDIHDGNERRIGPYTLQKLLGEGGFGSVYLADQQEPVRRKVALKLIKPGMDTRQVIARFDAERQALAMMDHPNIARIYDAAATSTGRPYFVMELVDGPPITDYCDAHQLGVRERLELLLPVCQAVHHAHQKGIIHRDLKPSNVLVSIVDGVATPKVIDFGIAKALTDRLTPNTAAITELRQMIGTPQYMSPEQAQSNLVDADTRSDIYSLGVLMYELLTGVTPFDAGELRRAAIGEVHRILSEVDPPRPSTRLSTIGDIAQVAADRQTEPARLNTLLRRELDWVVMKCLEKDRARRYASAAELVADIGRYLAGETVMAVAPTRGYRLRKFVTRNRKSVLAASVTSVSMLVGVAALAVGLRAARVGRSEAVAALAEARTSRDLAVTREHEATTQRAAAESSAKIAASVNDFLREMLSAPDPTDGGAKDVTVRSVLDRARDGIEKNFAALPNEEAAIRDTLGGTYHALGDAQAALPQFERAAAIQRELHGIESPESITADGFLADTLISLGRYDEAVTLSRSVLERATKQTGEDSVDTFMRMIDLGVPLMLGGKPAEALPLFRKAANGLESMQGATAVLTLDARGNVATALGRLGDDNAAAAELAGVIAAFPAEPTDAPTKMSLRTARVNYAGLLGTLDRGNEAEAMLRQILNTDRATYGEDHPLTLQTAHTLAGTLLNLGKRDEAIALWAPTLADAERKFGVDHPNTFYIRGSMIRALVEAGRPAEAIPLLERSWATCVHNGNTTDPLAANVIARLVDVYEKVGDPAAAAKWRALMPASTQPDATQPSK